MNNIEQIALSALIKGYIHLDSVDEIIFTSYHLIIFRTVKQLIEKGAVLPLSTGAIYNSITGADKKLALALKEINEIDIPESSQVLSLLQDRYMLTELLQLVGKQLAENKADRLALQALLDSGQDASELVSASELLTDEPPSPVHGPDITSLPLISMATGGVHGFWVIGGETGQGKSTLAWQIALEVGRELPVLYYDLDGTGQDALVRRTYEICGKDLRKSRLALERIILRDSIRQLEKDLLAVRHPALLVIDSLQTLPSSNDPKQRRSSLDNWISRLKTLTKRGYHILAVSEIARWSYGEASLGGYKETGGIEYAASVATRLLNKEDDETLIEFHILKNRHYPTKGKICYLARDESRGFWFKEIQDGMSDNDGWD